MFREIPLLIGTWCVGLFILLLPTLIVKIFGREIEEE